MGRGQTVTLIRAALLVAVLAGLLGMHVLTAGHDGGHGALPAATAHHAMATTDEAATVVGGDDASPTAKRTGGAGWDVGIAACVLFLAFGAAAIGLVRSRFAGVAAGPTLWLRMALLALRRRGPPHPPPRGTLCVIRV